MITEQTILKNIGNYIRLGGNGIMDGLKQPKNKYAFLKIMGLRRADVTAEDQAVWIKRYRMKKSWYLPRYHWNQDYEIITPKEYKQLSAY